VCGEAVMMSDNKNLKKEDGDIEGIQMNIDYKQISVRYLRTLSSTTSRSVFLPCLYAREFTPFGQYH
jgi:hypothetical protein